MERKETHSRVWLIDRMIGQLDELPEEGFGREGKFQALDSIWGLLPADTEPDPSEGLEMLKLFYGIKSPVLRARVRQLLEKLSEDH